MVLKKPIFACLLATVALIAAPVAKAGPIDWAVSGFELEANLTANGGNSYSLAMTITNVENASTGYVQGYSLQLFNSNISSVSFGSPSFTTTGSQSGVLLLLAANAQANNSANGVGNNACDSTGGGFGSVCEILYPSGYIGLAKGQSVTFNVNIDSGGATVMNSSLWHLISNATGANDGTGGNVYAISATPNGVPEPASLGLLGAGLAGLGIKLRRRAKKA